MQYDTIEIKLRYWENDCEASFKGCHDRKIIWTITGKWLECDIDNDDYDRTIDDHNDNDHEDDKDEKIDDENYKEKDSDIDVNHGIS